MKIQMLAGAAMAALIGIAVPVSAASPSYPSNAKSVAPSADRAVAAFYASRNNAPLWLSGANLEAANQFVAALERAPLDGLANGPDLAARARMLIARGQAGDAGAKAEAERLLSSAWVNYATALRSPMAGMSYADNWVKPRSLTAGQILASAAAAHSLSRHVAEVSAVNPVYSALRDAAWSAAQANGGALDPRVITSLDRARVSPFQNRYIMVDAASARLFMIEDGRIADVMKVIVGKPGQETQTPMVASTIYYATLNPYWHVTDGLVRELIAPNVMKQGAKYLSERGYQLFDRYGDDAQQIDPASVDWPAVAAGRQNIEVRQLPGPANSMGQMKFGFANPYDIYLHDTPRKELFSQADRDLSHGCIRLEDAPRLARWLVGRDPSGSSEAPEQHVALRSPVPIYVTYLTAHAENGGLAFADDIYGRDASAASMQVASLR